MLLGFLIFTPFNLPITMEILLAKLLFLIFAANSGRLLIWDYEEEKKYVPLWVKLLLSIFHHYGWIEENIWNDPFLVAKSKIKLEHRFMRYNQSLVQNLLLLTVWNERQFLNQKFKNVDEKKALHKKTQKQRDRQWQFTLKMMIKLFKYCH